MWNYLIDTGNVIGALGEDEADYISGDLLEYLGECAKFNAVVQTNDARAIRL